MSRRMSVFISRFLNDLGYSPDMVKLRQQSSGARDSQSELISIMECGSKREGLSLPYENDMDEMQIVNRIECYEQYGHANAAAYNQPITFHMERLDTTAQGYVLLRCVSPKRKVETVPLVLDALVEIHGLLYLSSDSWKYNDKRVNHQIFSSAYYGTLATPCRDNEGPSSPLMAFDGMSSDHVMAIRCHCPDLISSWRTRRRLYDWPSAELVDTISTLDSHVVPIGYKGSPVHFLEWRICFTKGEICLIENLNDCQTKIIVLMKLISKHVLKSVCKEITSYTMKNLVLWIAEKYPSRLFVESRLMAMLRHSLKLLKKCITIKKLPSYMIQERNLLADRLSDDHVRKLCETIDQLLQEGPRMLLRCPKIRDGLNTFRIAPNQFYLSARIRRRLEPIFHMQLMLNKDHIDRMLSNNPLTSFTDILKTILNDPNAPARAIRDIIPMILPDFSELMLKDEDPLKVYMDRFRYHLS